MTGWEPSGPVETALATAAERDDRTAFHTALAGGILVLPISPEAAAGQAPMAWATGVVDGITHVIAFTSLDAMHAVVRPDPPPFRLTTMIDLARHWPNPAWWLAVNPSLPIAAQLSPADLADLPDPGNDASPEAALARAIQADDRDSFVAALLRAELLLPLRPDGSPSRDLTDPEFPWALAHDPAGQPIVAVFTSSQWFRLVLGDVDYISTNLFQLSRIWPNTAWTLAVNPGTALTGTVPGDSVRELGSWMGQLRAVIVDEVEQQRAERLAELSEALDEELAGQPTTTPDQEDETEPEPDEPWLQILLPPAHVGAYLEQNYNWVAGVVHRGRAGETPAKLYRRVGVLGPGSPFDEADPSVTVLRWEPSPDDPPDLGVVPAMESRQVPDGAQLHLLHADGLVELVAVYGAGRWESPGGLAHVESTPPPNDPPGPGGG